MRHIRSRLSFANVVSVIALFVAVGGTAVAAVMITSNSQVGSGVISGHKPPSGKHSNVIAGSITGQDVADASLGPADVRSVVLRPAGGPSQVQAAASPGQPVIKSIPLSPNTWTQEAHDVDLTFGWVKTEPNNCTEGGTGVEADVYDVATGKLLLGRVSSGLNSDSMGHQVGGVTDLGMSHVPEAGSRRRVQFRARLRNACGVSVKLDSIHLTVVAFR